MSGPATGNSVMRTFSAIYNWAKIRSPVPDKNPVQFIKGQWFDVPRRENLVKADQLADFW